MVDDFGGYALSGGVYHVVIYFILNILNLYFIYKYSI